MTDDEEGTDKHDEPDQVASDIAGALSAPTTCTGCGTRVWAVPGTPQPRCLACARDAWGITWASGDVVGTWHPSGGGTAPEPPPVDNRTTVLMCFWCDKTWPAPLNTSPGWVSILLDEHEQQDHPHTLKEK